MATSPAAPRRGHVDRGTLDLSGGWHDAGDYNKYVWTPLERHPQPAPGLGAQPGVFADGDLDIPESGNGIPDMLDEVEWALDWLLKMQLPDGSVLSQMHVDGWASETPPSADPNPRFYHDPTLESGAIFAGCCALASRVYAAAGLTHARRDARYGGRGRVGLAVSQGDNDAKAWAAAELFRLDPTNRCP